VLPVTSAPVRGLFLAGTWMCPRRCARERAGDSREARFAREEEGRRAVDFSTVTWGLLQERYTGPNYRETTGTLERRGDSADFDGVIQRM
jgi:hypothetical protein